MLHLCCCVCVCAYICRMCVNRCRKLARIKENLPMDYFFSFFSFSPMALNTSTNQLESPCCVVGLRKRYWCKMGVSTCKFDREGKKSLKCKSRHLKFFFFCLQCNSVYDGKSPPPSLYSMIPFHAFTPSLCFFF